MSKKVPRILLVLSFILFYSCFLGLGLACLWNVLGFAVTAAYFGTGVLREHPRFFPFCLCIGFLSLVALICLVALNVKLSKKMTYTKLIGVVQSLCSLLLSVPAFYCFENLFRFLQRIY